VRDYAGAIVEQIGRRGLSIDLTRCKMIARQEGDLEQATPAVSRPRATWWRRSGGELILAPAKQPHRPEVQGARDQATAQTAGGRCLKKRRRCLKRAASDHTARLSPILRSPHCPERDDRQPNKHRRMRRLGRPARAEGLQEHWQIAERLGL